VSAPDRPARTPLDAWLAARLSLSGDAPGREDLDAWHLAALRRTIAQARAKSPFYAVKLAHLPPDFPAALSGMAACPRTLPAELSRDHRPFLAVPLGEVEHMTTLATSGTTGGPKRLAFTAADLESTLDFFHHGMATFTRPGDTVLIVLPAPRVAALLATALDRLGARGVAGSLLAHQGEADAPDREPITAFCRDMALARPRVLVAAPRQLALFADDPDACDAARGRLRAVLSSGEPLSPDLRRRVETRFGCAVFDHYGLTETGFGGGVECAAHAGYHLREADLYFEIVDPATGRVLPEGATGEVVATTLLRQAMPLVRYATGDAAAMLPGPCPCGSPLRRLGPVSGRYDGRGRIIVLKKGGAGAP
jgi:phenylacetate-coenzyme A ligase PaaK-like adenylate-forming protein